MREVIITVKGGVAEVYVVPLGVRVKIVDFDVEGEPESVLGEFEGQACSISEHES